MIRLYAPDSYHQADPGLITARCNGCGRAGWKGELIPETLYGLLITEACNIHDWMYFEGRTLEDKREADRVFLNNMIRLINTAGGCWLIRMLRRRRALKYYEAVNCYGGPAFWTDKPT